MLQHRAAGPGRNHSKFLIPIYYLLYTDPVITHPGWVIIDNRYWTIPRGVKAPPQAHNRKKSTVVSFGQTPRTQDPTLSEGKCLNQLQLDRQAAQTRHWAEMKTVFLIASFVCVMNAFKLERHSGIFWQIWKNNVKHTLSWVKVKKDFIVDTLC